MVKSRRVGDIHRCYFLQRRGDYRIVATVIFYLNQDSFYQGKLPRTVIRGLYGGHLDFREYTTASFSPRNVPLSWHFRNSALSTVFVLSAFY